MQVWVRAGSARVKFLMKIFVLFEIGLIVIRRKIQNFNFSNIKTKFSETSFDPSFSLANFQYSKIQNLGFMKLNLEILAKWPYFNKKLFFRFKFTHLCHKSTKYKVYRWNLMPKRCPRQIFYLFIEKKITISNISDRNVSR